MLEVADCQNDKPVVSGALVVKGRIVDFLIDETKLVMRSLFLRAIMIKIVRDLKLYAAERYLMLFRGFQ